MIFQSDTMGGNITEERRLDYKLQRERNRRVEITDHRADLRCC